MSPKEAIKVLKEIRDNEDGYSCDSDYADAVFNVAIEALEKQVPMKPLPEEMDIFGNPVLPCGNCGEAFGQPMPYCPWCGQALAESEEEGNE